MHRISPAAPGFVKNRIKTLEKRSKSGRSPFFWRENAENSDDREIQNLAQGCQSFVGATYQNGKDVPNDHKIYEIVIKVTKWPQNILNGSTIYHHFPFQGPPKYNPNLDFWVEKIYHLATLICCRIASHCKRFQKNFIMKRQERRDFRHSVVPNGN
jgi:hypothetical protein